MLEKNEKIVTFPVCDTHFHLYDLLEYQKNPLPLSQIQNYYGCVSLHSREEADFLFNGVGSLPLAYTSLSATPSSGKNPATPSLIYSFGIHPQKPELKLLETLEALLKAEKISCVGEAGFDFFTEEFKNNKEMQQTVWEAQLELAIFYKKPVLIHLRKAFQKLFEYSSELKKLPSVIFHGFPGSSAEAFSLLNKGINAYFSFGKVLLRGSVKAFDGLEKLPEDRLLLETDAPYMTLKDQNFTPAIDILSVYEIAVAHRCGLGIQDFSNQIFNNYKQAFFI